MDLIGLISDAARKAGRIMRDAETDRIQVISKEGHANFATEYDKKVQDYLFTTLAEQIPEAHFLGEENGKDTFEKEDTRGLTFVIDPIDGTSNFMKGLFPSVTSIGLLKDGEPFIGVVYNPWSDQLFRAQKGGGAFENDNPIHSSESGLSDSLVMMGTGPYYPELPDQALRLASKYIKRCVDIRRSGSAAWDLCMVASGRCGMYFEPIIQLWDYCAGALILTEAGGTITDFAGNELPFTGSSTVVAASAGIVREGGYLPGEMMNGRTAFT